VRKIGKKIGNAMRRKEENNGGPFIPLIKCS
jgi:hypothetical protein